MQLTDHFSLEELTASSTAQRLGIANTPSLETVASLTRLAMGLEQVRVILGSQAIHVDSGYRCEDLERVLCAKDYQRWCNARGKPQTSSSWAEYFTSKAHPQGFAADIVCPGFGDPAKVYAAIKASSLRFDQLLIEGTWVHISFAPAARRQCMQVSFVDGVPSYTQEA